VSAYPSGAVRNDLPEEANGELVAQATSRALSDSFAGSTRTRPEQPTASCSSRSSKQTAR
jgi:hypothetical protein